MMRGIRSGLEHSITGELFSKRVLLLLFVCLLYGGCRSGQPAPSIEFTIIPLAQEGGTQRLDPLEGRVEGARPGQQIVLYARSGGLWYVQPFADQQFTTIQSDSTWRNTTHLGTEYAALLVESDYLPAAITEVLPKQGGAVVAVAVTDGTPPFFFQTRWFRVAVGLAGLFALLMLYRYRLRSVTRQLNIRFEERLAERTRIAQELHDTLLQGVLSASMQLHVAVDNLPADSPARAQFGRVQQLMGQVIEEGRNAVRGLRTGSSDSLSLEQALSIISQDLSAEGRPDFRVVVEGRPRRLHPAVHDEVYRIGHEALVNAFRHSRAKNIEVGVEYVADSLRLLVNDDGVGIDAQVLRSGRDGHWGLSGMRERAERIGARLKVRSRAAAGTEVELTVPGRVAFQNHATSFPRRWLAKLRRRKASGRVPAEHGSEGEE
jgi:signal transduction histidine kinase